MNADKYNKGMRASDQAVNAGISMPQDVDLEKVALGACMIDTTAIIVVNEVLKPSHFYIEAHELIFKAMLALYIKGVPIDMLTVVDRLRETKDLEKIGGPLYITELTNKVASAANLEYHCRILFQLAMRREGYKLAIEAANKMLDRSKDIFETRDDLARDSMVTSFNNIFLYRDINKVLDDAEQQPEMKMLAGSLIRKGEVQIAFAQAGVGKSILSMQIANAISKGEEAFEGITKNECAPQKVLYFDFELTDRNLLKRYSNELTGEKYRFDENLIHVSFNPDFLDFEEKLDKIVSKQIELSLIHISEPTRPY